MPRHDTLFAKKAFSLFAFQRTNGLVHLKAMRILVIEDERKTAAFLAKGLREAGFSVDLARDGETGLKFALAAKFDLLVVDVMLPRKDGWEVVAGLRRDGMRTPILLLTARDSVR